MDDSERALAMKAFRRAVAIAGGQVGFEQLTGIRQQTVSKRLKTNFPLRVGEVLDVELLTGVSRYDLRPDVFVRGQDSYPPLTKPDDRSPAHRAKPA